MTDGADLALLLVRAVTAGISLAACIVMLITLLAFRKYRTVAGRLVLVLTTTVGASAAANLLTPLVGLNDGLCVFQGVAMQFADSASGVWTVIIAINLFLIVVANFRETNKFEKWYHIMGWPIPVLFTVLPATTKSYGETSIWCWIQSDGLGNVWRFACFYAPLFVYLVAIALLYLVIFIKLSRTFNEMASAKSAKVIENERRMLRSLVAYPLIFLLVWASGGGSVYWLLVVQSLTVCSQGLLNSLAYGLDSQTRKRLCGLLGRRKKKTARKMSTFRRRQKVNVKRGDYVMFTDADTTTDEHTSSASPLVDPPVSAAQAPQPIASSPPSHSAPTPPQPLHPHEAHHRSRN